SKCLFWLDKPIKLRSREEMHERHRPRRIRQDPADDQHLARRDHGHARARPTGSVACAGRRAARAARSPSDRTSGPSRRAIAAPGTGSLLRPMAPERAVAEATLGGTVPGPRVAAAARHTGG